MPLFYGALPAGCAQGTSMTPVPYLLTGNIYQKVLVARFKACWSRLAGGISLELGKALIDLFQPFHEGLDGFFDPPLFLSKAFQGIFFLSFAGKLGLYPVRAFPASKGFLCLFTLFLGFQGSYCAHVLEPDLWIHIQRVDPHEDPGSGSMNTQDPIYIILEPGMVLAAEGFCLGEELPELLHQVPIFRQKRRSDAVCEEPELCFLFEHVRVDGYLFRLFQQSVEQGPELLRVGSVRDGDRGAGKMKMMGELVDRRIDEVVFTLEISVMDDDFPPFGVVYPVYPLTLLARKDYLELFRIRFQSKKKLFHLVLIHWATIPMEGKGCKGRENP